MPDARTTIRHTYERTIPAGIEDVWRAITDPDEQQAVVYESVAESSWMPGEPVRYRTADDVVMIEGQILDVDEPHRLVHSFAFTSAADPVAAADAPTRVTWTMETDDDGTRVMLVHDGFDDRSATWRSVEDSWDQRLDGLVELFEQD